MQNAPEAVPTGTMNQQRDAVVAADAAVLASVEALAHELHPGRALPAVSLDTRLDRDLGFDSLARVELMSRVEQATGRSLPEEMLAAAETPRDLVDALSAAPRSAASTPVPRAPERVPAPAAAEPSQARTLVEALEWHARRHPDRVHVVVTRARGTELVEEEITYAALWRAACSVAGALQARDAQPGEVVALMLPTGRDYFTVFAGILLAGAVPVPLYPPQRVAQLRDHLTRQAGILANCRARMLVTTAEVKRVARLLRTHAPSLRHIVSAEGLRETAAPAPAPAHAPAGERLALLQYTSGSTGNPKGVLLTHANLLANIRAMGKAVKASSTDVFVSWLPLYHDMGLIGAWLGSLYFGMRLVVMSPLTFLARPAVWLRVIDRQRGTLSAAPNSAYELCVRKIRDAEIEGLDLSSWRLAFNGSEAVSADTITAFTERFARYGFRPGAMAPVYGLAECSVGLAFPPPGRAPQVDVIDRDALLRAGRAVPAATGARALRVVACGRALAEHEIRTVDDAGHPVPERTEGHVQFRGPSATQGYLRNAEATRALLRGGWLDSGDLGYLVDGEIHLTGRTKDIIIRAGRHLHPEEIENAVGAIAGVRRGCVAVFGSRDARHGTERLVVLAETREQGETARARLRARIGEAVLKLIGEPADEIALVAPHTVPKTSSGKLRRQTSRALYEAGAAGAPAASARWQAMRFVAAALLPLLRRSARTLAALAYAAYAWAVFALAGAVTLVVVLVLPGLGARRTAAQLMARLIIVLTRTPLHVHGREHLPRQGACVVVCNHASYADAIALIAAMPLRLPYHFVAKRELALKWPTRLLLPRLGTLLVERADIERSMAEVDASTEALRQGEALIVFPEGTLRRLPGLQPFHLGAFVAAVRGVAPVVPVAMRGTRSILQGEQWFPRHGAILITIARAIDVPPDAPTPFAAAVTLRDTARRAILERCGEPDVGEGHADH